MSGAVPRRAVHYAMALSCILAAAFAAAAESPKPPDGRGLIAGWKFDEPSGDRIADSSGNRLDGSWTGAVWVPGVFQQALKLDKSSLRIPHSAKLKPKEQITISAWVKPSDLSGYQSIYRKEDGDERILLMFQRQYEQAHATRKAAEAEQRRRSALGKAALAEWDRANLEHFPEPLDLAAQARRTLQHYMTLNQHQFAGAPDCTCVHFLWRLLPKPTGPEPLGGWDFGDATSRAVINWPALREMTGDTETGRKQEEGNRRFVLALLHPEKGLSMNLDAHDILKPGGTNCETCCTADMIELAEAMAACATLDPELRDWVDLHDDVESMTVNSIARTQLVFTPEFERVLAAYWGDAAGETLQAMRLLDGSWTAAYGPGDLSRREGLHVIPGGCCVYSGMRGLHAGWRDAMGFEAGQLRIHYFLDRRSAQASLTTAQPKSGEAEIVLHADAKVLVRVPAWLAPSQMTLTVAGRQRLAGDRLDATGHYADLGPLPAGTRIRVRFPLQERVTKETLAGVQHTITWRGNYVVKMSPRGQCLPIYP